MKIFLFFLAWLACLPLTRASDDAVNWAYTYDAKTLPDDPESDPQWSMPIKPSNADAVSQLENGKLIIDSGSSAVDAISYRLSGESWAPNDDGSTVEVKMKVISRLPGDGAAQSLVIADGKHNYRLRFSETGLLLPDGKKVPFDTTTEAWVYRVVLDGSGTAEVFADGESLIQLEGAPSGQKYLEFGDRTHGEGGRCEWSFVRWTNAGAFQP